MTDSPLFLYDFSQIIGIEYVNKRKYTAKHHKSETNILQVKINISDNRYTVAI
jgi:hypothetical protein